MEAAIFTLKIPSMLTLGVGGWLGQDSIVMLGINMNWLSFLEGIANAGVCVIASMILKIVHYLYIAV